ncbi:MAG: DUF2807 domain-containing protein [Kofleriaceae bacterium]
MRLGLLLLVTGCHSLWPDDDLVGNGTLVELRPPVGAFTGVTVDNAFVVDVGIGEPALVVTLDANIVDADIVQFTIVDNVLTIRQCDGCRDFAPSAGAAVHCTSPSIDTIRATGEVVITAATNAETITLSSSGESRLAVTASGAAVISAEASEGSRLDLAGPAPSLYVRASGEASLRTTGATAVLDVAGRDSARIATRASDSAVVTASGDATIEIAGNPADRELHVTDDAHVSFP